MTPLEHYRKAESLLAEAHYLRQNRHDDRSYMRRAAVHAQLAACHMTAGVWDRAPGEVYDPHTEPHGK